MARLTKRVVDGAEAADRRFTVWDAELTGFGLRIEPSGAKTFVIRYRANGGGRKAPERLMTIGRYGMLTVDDARQKAKTLLAEVKLGSDPAVRRASQRKVPRFSQAAEQMLAEAEEVADTRPREARLRPGSIRNYRSLLRRHLTPAIGTLSLEAVTTAELARLHQNLGKRTPVTANRCLELVGSVFKYAGTQGFVPKGINPARGIAAFKEHRRERFLSTDELARLGDAIRTAETTGIEWIIDVTKKAKHVPRSGQRAKIDPGAAAALRLLIFTGARLREILHARWDDVDFERRLLNVHGKTGPRAVLLPAPALSILAQLARKGTYVFPSESSEMSRDKPRSDLNRPWRAVRRSAGLDGLRIHDLRHSYASVAAGQGSSLPIIGKLLGHSQPQTTSRYSHLADDPLRAVAEKVAATVADAFGSATTAGTTIAPPLLANASDPPAMDG